MIRESLLDRAFNRLLKYFGTRVVVRPPASAAELAELESLAGPLPRDLVMFLSTCSGLRVVLAPPEPAWSIHAAHEMIGVLRRPRETGLPPAFLPIHDGVRTDWLVLETGALHGTLVRWEPHDNEALLVGSAFEPYFDAFCYYLVATFDGHGRPIRPVRKDFDAGYIAQYDPQLQAMSRRTDVLSAIRELEAVAASGADFD